MFPHSYFPGRYFDPDYFPPKSGVVVPPAAAATSDTGRHKRFGVAMRRREHSNQRPIWLRKRLGLWRDKV